MTNKIELNIHSKLRINQRSKMRYHDVKAIVLSGAYSRIGMDLNKKNVCHYLCYSIVDAAHYILVVDEKVNEVITVMPLEFASWMIDQDALKHIKHIAEIHYKIAGLRKAFNSQELNSFGRTYNILQSKIKNATENKSDLAQDKDVLRRYTLEASHICIHYHFPELMAYLDRFFGKELIQYIKDNNKKENFILSNSSLMGVFYFYLDKFKYKKCDHIVEQLKEHKLTSELNITDYKSIGRVAEEFKFIQGSVFGLLHIFKYYYSDYLNVLDNLNFEQHNLKDAAKIIDEFYLTEEQKILIFNEVTSSGKIQNFQKYEFMLEFEEGSPFSFVYKDFKKETIDQVKQSAKKIIKKNVSCKLKNIKKITILFADKEYPVDIHSQTNKIIENNNDNKSTKCVYFEIKLKSKIKKEYCYEVNNNILIEEVIKDAHNILFSEFANSFDFSLVDSISIFESKNKRQNLKKCIKKLVNMQNPDYKKVDERAGTLEGEFHYEIISKNNDIFTFTHKIKTKVTEYRLVKRTIGILNHHIDSIIKLSDIVSATVLLPNGDKIDLMNKIKEECSTHHNVGFDKEGRKSFIFKLDLKNNEIYEIPHEVKKKYTVDKIINRAKDILNYYLDIKEDLNFKDIKEITLIDSDGKNYLLNNIL